MHKDDTTNLAALLARIQLGDRAAFGSLYRATSPQLFGAVRRIAGNAEVAEEVLQEVYVTVWRTAGSFDSRLAQPMTWLTSIARHRAIDALRRRAARPATVSQFDMHGGGDGDDIDAFERLPAEAPGPLELLEEASRTQSLERCMETLSGAQRSCLALAYYQGFSHSEVAQHLREPLGTVKTWLRRALQSLRSCLDRAATPPAREAH